jgi:hypothetical protein
MALTHVRRLNPYFRGYSVNSSVISPLSILLIMLLQVGSDDCDIRIFQNEDVVAEVSEADQILALAAVHLTKCAA